LIIVDKINPKDNVHVYICLIYIPIIYWLSILRSYIILYIKIYKNWE